MTHRSNSSDGARAETFEPLREENVWNDMRTGHRFVIWLEGSTSYYWCAQCTTHLAFASDLVSEAFRGRTGIAWLFDRVVNVYLGRAEDRVMTTGLHTITEIFCTTCHENLGWKYEQACEASQKYKQGKYILERELIQHCSELVVARSVPGVTVIPFRQQTLRNNVSLLTLPTGRDASETLNDGDQEHDGEEEEEENASLNAVFRGGSDSNVRRWRHMLDAVDASRRLVDAAPTPNDPRVTKRLTPSPREVYTMFFCPTVRPRVALAATRALPQEQHVNGLRVIAPSTQTTPLTEDDHHDVLPHASRPSDTQPSHDRTRRKKKRLSSAGIRLSRHVQRVRVHLVS